MYIHKHNINETDENFNPLYALHIGGIKMQCAISFNSIVPIVQMPCPSEHSVTGRFNKNSVLKKMKRFHCKKRQSKG